MKYEKFVKSFRNPDGVPPLIIDERGCLEILTEITGHHLTSLDECRTGEIANVYLYDIPEERKMFDITTVRKCIDDLGLIPYEGKNIYILRAIDTGTPEAMNALLKILEDCPLYASIILVVTNPEALLETIHSRCMNFFREFSRENLREELKKAFEEYLRWDVWPFVSELFHTKMDKHEAIGLLRYAILYGPGDNLEALEQGIIDIRMSHESPKYILDTLFLIPH